jgi:hypothetical protein
VELTGRKWAGLLAAAAYLYAPYVLRNAFERGSPEAFGTFLYPWVLWGLVRLAKRPTGGRLLVASGLWAICIASHVLAPLMLAPFALLLAVFLSWRYRTAMPLLALLAGALMTAFVWLPMAAEQRWVHIERDFRQIYASPAYNPLALDRLLAPPAVYDVLRDDNSTGDQVGLWHAWWLVIGIPIALYAWKKGRRDMAWIIGVATLLGLLLFWMLTAASDSVWLRLEPILTRLQYRFRLLGIQSLAAAVLAGACIALLPRRWQPRVALLLVGLLLLTALPSLYLGLQHQYANFGTTVSLQQVRKAEIASGGTAFTYFGEFMPRWRTLPLDQSAADQLGPNFNPEDSPLADPPPSVEVRSAQVRSDAWDLFVESTQPATLTLHLLYYPRWKAFVDGAATPLRPQAESGYSQISVPSGAHQIKLRYGATSAEVLGWTISLLALLTLLVFAICRRSARATAPRPEMTSASGAASHPTLLSEEGQAVAPPWWLLASLTGVLVFKAAYIDTSTTWLRCVSTPDRVCGAQASTDVPFIGGPRLRGYSIPSGTFEPGDVVRVNLYWQGEPDLSNRLASFVHIRNSQKGGPINPSTGNEIWAQDEHETPAGLFTTEYLPGRLYMDEFRVRLPNDMPVGEYLLEVGWADQGTGEQLEPQADAVKPPLGILWRSILLPSLTVTG